MPPFGPVSRRELIAVPQRAGFEGPFSGRKHQIMLLSIRRMSIPNPRAGDIGKALLARILSQAGISRSEWELL